jgi:chromosome segregation ATPase
MNAKTVVLVVLCAGLAIALVLSRRTANQQREDNEATIVRLSNEWVQTSTQLNETTKTNTLLETNLAFRTEALQSVSNKLEAISADLARTEAQAKAAAQAAQEEMAKRDAKIADLELQREDLSKQMTNLSLSITNLEGQIQETQRKLASSEGDREFLLKELKRLQIEKAALEKQMTDLAFLRTQVHKLRDELAISRRLDWIRRGLFGFPAKGGEIMQNGFVTGTPRSNDNLNVEIKREGGAKILSPATNAPARTNAPAK